MSASQSPRGREDSPRPPKYSRSKEKDRHDRAYVWLDGKKVWLGRYGSPESKTKYAELISGNQNSGPRSEGVAQIGATPPTVSELILAYLEYARRYYRTPDGKDGREYELSRDVCRFVRKSDGQRPACEIGPKRLMAVRQELIDSGLSRKFINKQIDRLRRMFKWGAEEELFSSIVYQDLSMVAGLRKGRSDAKENPPIRPVGGDVVAATLVELPEVLFDMIKVQLLTGMRPGELFIMSPHKIDRSGKAWIYTPIKHKTDYRGHHRSIAIGPKAQDILLRYLARESDACLFQPRDSEAKRLAEREANRKVPLSCGNIRGSNRKADPKNKPGTNYTTESYRQAIQRAAKRAGVEKWTPHQLRHAAATYIRKEFGLDASQAVLGHKGAKVSEVYAEVDQAKAVEVALRIG
jgi:integrase